MLNKYFLAKMNIPAYLKKFLYNRYVYTEIEGIPPIIFKGNGKNLLDYRIDGASGGVGDRTENLFSSTIVNDYHLNQTTGLPTYQVNRCATIDPILINNNSLILQYKSEVENTLFMYSLFSNDTLIRRVTGNVSEATIDTTGANKIYFSFYALKGSVTSNNLSEIMLSENNIVYEPYGYKVPVVVSGKNLLQNKATSRTINGVTCTVNDDKSVTFTGSPERSFDLIFNSSLILKPGTYIYTNGLTQSDSRIRVDMYVSGTGGNINYWANPSVTFNTTNTYNFVSRIFIQGNAGELAGLTIYPMLRESSITDDTYEPYIEPTTTNIYLDEPIEANESISLSDTNTNIPTIRGTNVLTVDTTVQPSKIYIKVGGG